MAMLRTILLMGNLMMTSATIALAAGEFDARNHVLCERVLDYGDKHYDEKTHLVFGDEHYGKEYKDLLDVCQQSPEYAAALLDANRNVDRANAIISAILNHQWLADKGTVWEGNFIWWHHQKRPDDSNAVAFTAPWLCYCLLEHADRLTQENKSQLSKALPLCLQSIQNHGGQVHYDNIWLLKAASVLMLSRALNQPALMKDAENRLDQWMRYVSQQGIDEFNSPCYAAVNIYALEFLWKYTPKSAASLSAKAAQALDYLYADVFQNWHWEGSIGAGTHSRAYPCDRLDGTSLVALLVYKQCGSTLRCPASCFDYNFVVNDYCVPAPVRALARKEGRPPLWLRASHPVHGTSERVERSLYMVPEVSFGTQTGHRVNVDQAVPFKITYGGAERSTHASFIRPVPATFEGQFVASPVRFVAHQDGPAAIVLYEADMKDQRTNAYLRLVIEPVEGGALDEVLVDGKPYNRTQFELMPGSVIAWRVANALVAIRLLNGWGVEASEPDRLVPKKYELSYDKNIGLCLHCLLAYKVMKPIGVNDLSCGLAVRVGQVSEFGNLVTLANAVSSWRLDETRKDSTRDISWQAGGTVQRLLWDSGKNGIIERYTDGRKLGAFPLYDSPLINLKAGDPLRVNLSP